MTRYSFFRSVGCACVLAAGLSGCSSDPTLYTLAPLSGVSAPVRVPVVEVRTPVVAMRLDRDTIVRGNEGYQTKLASGDSWSEPLPEMIGHVLATDLSQRLAGTTVFAQNDAVTTTPSAFVEVTIRSFEADSRGRALVAGSAAVYPAGKMIGPVLTEPFLWQSSDGAGKNTARLAELLSQGVSAMADRVAERVRELPPPVRK